MSDEKILNENEQAVQEPADEVMDAVSGGMTVRKIDRKERQTEKYAKIHEEKLKGGYKIHRDETEQKSIEEAIRELTADKTTK